MKEIYIYSDPDFYHPSYPDGLALFDEKSNCAALLGSKYFRTQRSLTLWSIAQRNGYTPVSWWSKRFNLEKASNWYLDYLVVENQLLLI